MNKMSGGAGNRANCSNPVGKGAIRIAALALLLSTLLISSGCVGTTGTSKTASNQDSTPSAATISMAPGSVSFGSVAVGSTVSQSVTVTNGGGSNLTITQASTVVSGFNVTGISLPLVIGAGKQSTFNIVFSPKANGAVSGVVSVMSDLSSTANTVSVSGTGVTATSLLNSNASSLSFGTVSVGVSSSLTAILTNAGNSNVTVSKITISGASYSTSGVAAGLTLTPGQIATLHVTFDPLSTGSLPGTVAVASNASNSPATISLSGTGQQAATHSVSLNWTSSTSVVAGYNVYRSTVSGGPYTKLDSSAVTTDSYTDSTVLSGDTYYYVVTSVTSAGVESADSNQVSAIIP